MRARIARVASLTPHDLARWSSLVSRAIEPNIYLDPRWLLPSQRLHPDGRDLQVLLVEDGEELRGLLAFTIERAWRDFPFRAVSTAGLFLGTHAERHHPLVDRIAPAAVLDAMLEGLRSHRLPGLLALHKFVGDGPLADALTVAALQRGAGVEELLRRPWAFAHTGWPSPAPGASSTDGTMALPQELSLPTAAAKAVRNLRRSIRGLATAVETPIVLVDRSADPDAIADFVRFQAAGWKGDATTGGLAMGLSPETESWFHAIAEGFQADGDLRVFSLEADGQVIHMAINLRSAGGVFGFIDSYNEQFARFSVGHIGRVLGLARMTETDPDAFFDPDLDPFYTSGTVLYPDRRDRVNLMLAYGGPLSRTLLRLVPWARRLRDRIRDARTRS